MKPKSPIDVFCRGCGAESGRKCGTVPNRNLLRRRIRAGNPVESYWIRELPYFHGMRERDFLKSQAEWQKLDDWNKRIGKTDHVPVEG